MSPGHAKVVIDSRPTLPGHGGRQSDHRRNAVVEILPVAYEIIKFAVGLMLFGRQHWLSYVDLSYPDFLMIMRGQSSVPSWLTMALSMSTDLVFCEAEGRKCVANCAINYNVN